MRWIVFGAAAAVIALTCIWVATRTPFPVENAALAKVPLLKPGMKEPEVWRLLGLEEFNLHAQTSGSGPRTNWPSAYPLTPEKMLMTRWDLTKTPPVLNEVHIEPNRLGFTIGGGKLR